MDFRLALVVVRSSPVLAICLATLFCCCFPIVSGQIDWVDDDDDPGKSSSSTSLLFLFFLLTFLLLLLLVLNKHHNGFGLLFVKTFEGRELEMYIILCTIYTEYQAKHISIILPIFRVEDLILCTRLAFMSGD